MKIKDTTIEVAYKKAVNCGLGILPSFAKDGLLDEAKTRSACIAALRRAKSSRVKTFTFCLRTSPKGSAFSVAVAKILAQEVLKFLRDEKTHLKHIFICPEDKNSVKKFQRIIDGYLAHMLDVFGKPYVTVDAIIEYKGGIILIERSNPPFGWALPGGFVDYGESLEEAVRREVKEETNLTLTYLQQFHTYSDPRRDERFHTITTVYAARAKGKAKAGDDAKNLKVVSYRQLMKMDYAFDHKNVLRDYLRMRERGSL